MKTKVLGSVYLMLISLVATAGENQINWSGDLRFRNESIQEEQADPLPRSDRFRQRLRVRLAAEGKVNPETVAKLKISTGTTSNADTTTTNIDLNDYYAKKAFNLDWAFFQSQVMEGTTLTGGKHPIQFFTAGSSDLMYDSDLSFEGLHLKYENKKEDSRSFLNIGTHWLNERFSATGATDNTDVGIVAAQVGYEQKSGNTKWVIALGHHNFANIKGATAPAAKGNTLSTGTYSFLYKVSTLDLEISEMFYELPITFFYQMITNSEPTDRKNGAIVGLKYGKLKEVGSWNVSLDYRDIEKDATVGVLVDGDSSGGGTDVQSTRFSAGYQLAENTNMALTVYGGKKSISAAISPWYQRANLDFNFNF